MKNKLKDFAPDLIKWIRDGKVEVEGYLYKDGVYHLDLYTDSISIDQYLEALCDLGITVTLNEFFVDCIYEELEYDYNGAYFEGGIVAEHEVALVGNDVPLSYINQRIKDKDVELTYLK